MFASDIYQENDLILQVARGDENAFARLFTLYSDKLYSFIVSLSGSGQVAEDIVQDVFLKIWQKKEGLSSIENFNCYIFRMAHNHVLNILKRVAKETLILSELAYQSQPGTDTLLDIEYKDIQQVYREAIETLPPQQRLIFKLSRESGLKQQEIASKLNISISTVKSHMTQAFRSLRKVTHGSFLFLVIFF